MAAFSVNDALTKVVVTTYPVGEVMFVRGIMTIAMMTIALAALGQIGRVIPAIGWPVTMRSVFDAFASVTFITALGHMGLAELSALVLASPLIMTMLAVWIFGEPVGWRRWGAIVVGLIGTLLVVKPDPANLNAWALLGVAAAIGAASRDLATLRIDRSIPTLAVSIFSCIALTIAGLLLGLTERWVVFDLNTIYLIAAAAFLYSVATYLLVLAFRGVEVSVVSPFRYGLLLWAGIAGYVVFGEFPDRWSLAGAGLIVASGVYTLHREAVRRRYLAARPTTEP
jgi:drug/metabolite transporter (DMT)-like permease